MEQTSKGTSCHTAQSNFVLGFSWKTDGAVSPEHPAYNLWHNLSDRRAEFSLATFTRRETRSAISKFANELGEPLVLVRLVGSNNTDSNSIVRKVAMKSRILSYVIGLLDADQSISGIEVGDQVAKRFSYPWSEASKVRTGNALKRWAVWTLSGAEPLEE